MFATLALALMPCQFTQTFDGPELPSDWVIVNNSQPPGESSWHLGSPTFFAPFDGGFAACWPGAALNQGPVSAWLISPVVVWQNGTRVSFWTRAEGSFPDHLQVRLSLSGDSVNVGAGPFTVGDFTELAVDINPELLSAGYPTEWTQYSFRVQGMAAPVKGRLAFRYCMNDTVLFGSYVGIDSVTVTNQRLMGDQLGIAKVK